MLGFVGDLAHQNYLGIDSLNRDQKSNIIWLVVLKINFLIG